MKNTIIAIFILLLSGTFNSCKKFLDVKSDKSLAIPTTINDAQQLLDFYTLLNMTNTSMGCQSDDDFHLTPDYVNSLSEDNKNNYLWQKHAYNDNSYRSMYLVVFYCNLALETLEKYNPNPSELAEYNYVKGQAFFHRANAFYNIVQYWAKPYNSNTASNTPGIPIKLNTDPNASVTRASLEHSWQQVINDLEMAKALLPVSVHIKTRPSKAAAFAALSRIYLAKQDYVQSGKYADSTLQLYNTLIDYNNVSQTSNTPFVRFNDEVIYHSQYTGPATLSFNNWKVDSNLYQAYHANDLRKPVFYRSNGAGTFGFRGDYSQSTTSSHFNGYAVDEIYLIKAESLARQGNATEALEALNTLMIKRWKSGTFAPFTASNAQEALDIILMERRKELVLRGTRWFDLRRLNQEPQFAKTLKRNINGTIYELPPNDKRYTFYFPEMVIETWGIEQNER